MALLEMLGLRKPPSPKQLREMLPALHSFVDIAVKDGPKGSVCFENAGSKTFITSALPGMTTGQRTSFVYTNATGRFRFHATITGVDGKQASFAIPARIDTVQKFSGARRRSNARVDTTVPTQWRYASVGYIEAEWQKGVVSDISRTGCQLATDRPILAGNLLELKARISPDRDEVLLRAEVKRVVPIPGTKRHNAGLNFVAVAAGSDRAILEFINRRQADLRGRGLA